MGVLVALAMSKGLGVPVGVFQMVGDLDGAALFQQPVGLEVGCGGVGFGCRGQIESGLNQGVDAFWEPDVFESLGCRRRHNQTHGVR